MKEINITSIKGIRIGQAEDSVGGTGCSVIICDDGAVAGVDVRGGGPATRETDLLNPINMIQKIHAVMLSGGSAFGLDAASGAMQYLEEHNIGFNVGKSYIPIVCGASLFDLSIGNPKCRPDKSMGYTACINSESNTLHEGNYGAGCGASVGKLLGPSCAMKSGIGTYGVEINNVQVAAIVSVNACGNIVDPFTNIPLAGIYDSNLNKIVDAEEAVLSLLEHQHEPSLSNTTIGCIVTNAKITKAQCTKIAGIAHNGYAKAIRPVHTMNDGDTIFVLSTQEVEANVDTIGVLATQVMSKAIMRSATCAQGAFGLKANCDIK
ncbi:MAG: P1 family peptidase [Erysipelotrichaceae bacterium]